VGVDPTLESYWDAWSPVWQLVLEASSQLPALLPHRRAKSMKAV
jgi:hypothetical protein